MEYRQLPHGSEGEKFSVIGLGLGGNCLLFIQCRLHLGHLGGILFGHLLLHLHHLGLHLLHLCAVLCGGRLGRGVLRCNLLFLDTRVGICNNLGCDIINQSIGRILFT